MNETEFINIDGKWYETTETKDATGLISNGRFIEGPIDELVEALRNLAYGGIDDFGGSYVNLQSSREDISTARALLDRYEVKQ